MQCLINQRAKLSVKFTAKLFLVIFIMEGDRPAYKKTGSDLQLIANHPVFQFEASFFPSLFYCKLLLCPVSVSEDGNDGPVLFDAVDVHVG